MRVRLVGLALLSFACKRTPETPIVIGVVEPLTGPRASYGVSAKNGIDLAIAEENAAGRLGRKIEVVHLDDQGEGSIAVDAVRRLIAEEHVDLLIGEVASDAALAMAPAAQRAATPMLTPAATSPRVTDVGDYIFRICFADPFQADAMAHFAIRELSLDKAAVLRDLDSEYSIDLAEAFAARFTALGGHVVATEHFQQGDRSFAPALEKIRRAGAAAVYVPAYHLDVARLSTERERLGGAILLGSDGWDANELLLTAGPALEGSYFTAHVSMDDPRPEVKRFVEAYTKEYNEQPDATAALGYDAARYALAAIRETGSTDKEEVRAALAGLEGFTGVTGPIHLDARRDAIKPAVVVKIEGGRRVYVKSVAP